MSTEIATTEDKMQLKKAISPNTTNTADQAIKSIKFAYNAYDFFRKDTTNLGHKLTELKTELKDMDIFLRKTYKAMDTSPLCTYIENLAMAFTQQLELLKTQSERLCELLTI